MVNNENKEGYARLDVTSLTDLQLFELRAAVDTEARRRGLNFNVGEIGEKLAIALFKQRSDLPVLALAPKGTKNIDAISRDGDRYSIKTLQTAKKTGTVYPDPKDRERQLFEYILIVVVKDDLTLDKIVQLDWGQFCEVRSWDVRMNAWYLTRSKRTFDAGKQIFPKVDIDKDGELLSTKAE
ncbi:hypothetical protein P3W23_12945 [Luteibacter sp. PPL554]